MKTRYMDLVVVFEFGTNVVTEAQKTFTIDVIAGKKQQGLNTARKVFCRGSFCPAREK